MQIQLSPAHPDFGKVGFAELEGESANALINYTKKEGTHTATLLMTGSKPRLRCWV